MKKIDTKTRNCPSAREATRNPFEATIPSCSLALEQIKEKITLRLEKEKKTSIREGKGWDQA